MDCDTAAAPAVGTSDGAVKVLVAVAVAVEVLVSASDDDVVVAVSEGEDAPVSLLAVVVEPVPVAEPVVVGPVVEEPVEEAVLVAVSEGPPEVVDSVLVSVPDSVAVEVVVAVAVAVEVEVGAAVEVEVDVVDESSLPELASVLDVGIGTAVTEVRVPPEVVERSPVGVTMTMPSAVLDVAGPPGSDGLQKPMYCSNFGST